MTEIESFLIAAQKNAIRTNYIKAKVDNTQQNNKSGFCGDRDKTINLIIIGYSKQAQKEYKPKND